MGEIFIKTYFCVLFLFIPDIFLFTQQIANTTAIAKNVIREQVPGYIGMALLCILFSCYFCKPFGAIGSSISICLSYFFLVFYLNIVYIKKMKIDMLSFYRECYLRLSIFILTAGVTCFIICNAIYIGNILSSIMIKMLLIVLIYIVIIFWGLNYEEKLLIRNVINKLCIRRISND